MPRVCNETFWQWCLPLRGDHRREISVFITSERIPAISLLRIPWILDSAILDSLGWPMVVNLWTRYTDFCGTMAEGGGGVLFKKVNKLCCWQSWCVLGIFVLYIRREKNERWNWWIVFVFLTSWERRMNVRSLKRQSGFGLYIEIGILFLISWERGIGIGFLKK